MTKHDKKLLFGCRNGNLGWVEAGLKAGASADLCNAEGLAALIIAAGFGHEPICLALLEAGADLKIRDLAVTAAEEAGHGQLASMLAQWAPAPVFDGVPLWDQARALEKATQTGSIVEVRAMLESGVDPNASGGRNLPLGIAAKSGDLEMMELLHHHGCKLETANWFSPLCETLPSGKLDALKKLLEWGADPNHLGPNKRSPLHDACAQGRDDFVRVLLAAGALLEKRDDLGATPMDLAILRGSSADLIRTLSAAGAQVSSDTATKFCGQAYSTHGEAMLEALWEVAEEAFTAEHAEALIAALNSGRVRLAYTLIGHGLRTLDLSSIRAMQHPLAQVGVVPDQLGPLGEFGEEESLCKLAWSTFLGMPSKVHARVNGTDVDVLVFEHADGTVLYTTDASQMRDSLLGGNELMMHSADNDANIVQLIANIAAGTEDFEWSGNDEPTLRSFEQLYLGPMVIGDNHIALWQVIGLTQEEQECASDLGVFTVEAAWLRDGIDRVYRPGRETSPSLPAMAKALRQGLSQLEFFGPVDTQEDRQKLELPESADVIEGLIDGNLSKAADWGEILNAHDAHLIASALVEVLAHPVQLLCLLMAIGDFTSAHRRRLAERALTLPPNHVWAHHCNVESLMVLESLDEGFDAEEYGARRQRYRWDPEPVAAKAARYRQSLSKA